MTERIHTFLDGELTGEDLSAVEEREAIALLGSVEHVATHLRSLHAPDLASRIMDALPDDLYGQPVRIWKRRPLLWLWRQRTISITVRPGFALGMLAAAVIALVVTPGRQLPPQGPAVAVTATAEDAHLYVQFRLDAPDASDVRLAGSFTGWQPTVQLSETAPGVWSAMVPLDPGVHDYTFLVDGQEWVVDPNATNVEDSFGGMNSRLFLAAPLGAA